MLPKKAQSTSREASSDCLAIASSSILGLKMTILSKNVIFRPKTELEAIARWSVDASRKVDSAYFSNIGRNSGYFLLPIFLSSYLIGQCCVQLSNGQTVLCPS